MEVSRYSIPTPIDEHQSRNPASELTHAHPRVVHTYSRPLRRTPQSTSHDQECQRLRIVLGTTFRILLGGHLLSHSHSVQSALKLLSAGLDGHISHVMAPHLGGLPWPHVLKELDNVKGIHGKSYSQSDVQCQLRMVTQRLGQLGYPFDAGDPHRKMSTYGNELRLVRNRWAHNDEFTALEAMRAVDTVFIVLTHIGDINGAEKAASERTLLLYSLVSEEKVPPEGDFVAEEPSGDVHVAGDDSGSNDSFSDFTQRRTEFEPWNVVVTGSVETLDNLPKKAAKESVRATIEEIVDFEGPIHVNRLTKIVGYTYGLGKVHENRAKRIKAQIKAATCLTDSDGFVWASDVVQQQWLIHRRNSIGTDRSFLEISPREVSNGASERLRVLGPMGGVELRRATLKLFGRSKSTQKYVVHFDKALQLGLSEGDISFEAASQNYSAVIVKG